MPRSKASPGKSRPEGRRKSALMTAAIRTARVHSEAKRTGAHFTPPPLADFVARCLVAALPTDSQRTTLRVLDPSCGDGELLRAFAEAVNQNDRKSLRLMGVEDNDASLSDTRKRLTTLDVACELFHEDFLDVSQQFAKSQELSFLFTEPKAAVPFSQPDLIIANPPYVRTQVLGADRAQQLAERFGLKGRVDLYAAFLVAMTDVLKDGGLLGVITSNRFLTTRSGASVRAFIQSAYDIVEVIDLGDTKLFSAAVLPAVLIARKRGANAVANGSAPLFARVYEDLEPPDGSPVEPANNLLEMIEERREGKYEVDGRIFHMAFGDLVVSPEPSTPWRMTSPRETAWTERVESNASITIADIAKVRVGIKTTADPIYIREDWKEFPDDTRPEESLLRPMFTHHDAGRWCANKPDEQLRRILYTHDTVEGRRRAINLSNYPNAQKYLETHRKNLESRTYVIEAGRKWFEIWVPQDPAAWGLPKIVFPDISVEPRFFLDESGALVNGDCYWIAVKPDKIDLLYLILGVANSRTMSKYHDLAFPNKLYSGRRRFISQYVERYPLPDPGSAIAKAIVKESRKLVASKSASEKAEYDLEALVARAFGVEQT